MANPRATEELAGRAQHLIAIKHSPSYPVLKQIVETKISREMRRFINHPTLSQQELDYGRGFLRGMAVVLEMIEKGEEQLQQAIRRGRALEEAEDIG